MPNPNRRDGQRFPDGPDEFQRRWQELAEHLTEEFSQDLAANTPDDGGLPGPNGEAGHDAADAVAADGVAPVSPAVSGDSGEALPTVSSDVSLTWGPRDWVEPPEDDDDFVPDDPQPISQTEPLLVLAWIAVGIGLVGLGLLGVFHLKVSWIISRALVLVLLAGIGTLIWRLPMTRENPDDPGARV